LYAKLAVPKTYVGFTLNERLFTRPYSIFSPFFSIVNTNDVLKRILSQRKDQSSITFKDLIDEITKLMHRTEISALNTTDNSKNVKKKINNIEMTVNNRSGNKKVGFY